MKKAPKKTRAQTKQETRAALVRAAMELFAKHGLDVPSLDDICERAGKTRGAFYVHFADRDAIVTAVMEKVGRTFIDALVQSEDDDLATIAQRFVVALASGAYPLTPSRRSGRASVGGIRPYQLLDACARSTPIRKQYVALVEETIARVSTATERSQKKKAVRADVSPDGMALMLVCVVIGVQTLMDLEVPVDSAKNAASILKLLQRP
ncbi:MAG TPA: TetR/AcrR family transcriptional regulator [Polyangiaceae bacterium]|jgi:AcrR family transcriptional regulator|nr:TetR/AcrR family transcriptional regulator [Polyangiaceae bacterium]